MDALPQHCTYRGKSNSEKRTTPRAPAYHPKARKESPNTHLTGHTQGDDESIRDQSCDDSGSKWQQRNAYFYVLEPHPAVGMYRRTMKPFTGAETTRGWLPEDSAGASTGLHAPTVLRWSPRARRA